MDCFYLGKSKEYFTDRQEAAKLNDFEREMKSIIRNEEPVADVLQNIEFIIHKIYMEYSNITDRHVETALEYLLEMGKAQMDMPAEFLTELSPNVQAIVDGVNDILEFRESFAKKREDFFMKLKCVCRVLDSVQAHRDPRDDCSYLRFIGQFLR